MSDTEHFREQDEWTKIGMVTTSCAMLALVDARGGEGVEPAMEALWREVVHKRHRVWPSFEEFKGPGKHGIPGIETGLFFRTPSNGGYDVEARFCDEYGEGHLTICELRITMHDHDDENDEDFDLLHRVWDEQETWIREHFGDEAAGHANYGWGSDQSGLPLKVFVETKVYGHGVLFTHGRRDSAGSPKLTHRFKPFGHDAESPAT